ncbi:hypothetical protein MASR1M48_17510 [Lactococcus petauri]
MQEGIFIATVKNKKIGLASTDLLAVFYGDNTSDSIQTPKHRLIDWEVSDSDDEKDSFSIVLDNYDLSLIDSKLFKKGNTIIFQYGYQGNMSETFTGIINKRSGWRTLTISGNFKSEVAISERQKTQKWTNKTLSDVAKELFSDEGLNAIVDDTKSVQAVIMRQNETVMQFLKRKAKEIAGSYVVYVENDTGYFVKKRLHHQPVLTLHFATEAVEEDYITIGEPEFIDEQEGVAVEETVKGMDLLNKKPINEKGSNENSEQTSLGKGTYYFDEAVGGFKYRKATATSSDETGMGKPTQKQTADGAKGHAQSGFDDKNSKAFQLNWNIIGHPKLKAKVVVAVKCDSKEVSGNWYIKKCTHKGGVNSGYVTSLNLTRNALGLLPGTQPATPKGGTNNKEADSKKSNERSYVFDEQAGKLRPKI